MRSRNWTNVLIALSFLGVGFFFGRLSFPQKESNQKQLPVTSVRSSEGPKSTSSFSSSLLSHCSLGELETRTREEAGKLKGQQNSALLSLLLREWAEREPQGALAFAQEQQREELIYESLLIFGSSQPSFALEWIAENITDLGLQNHFASAIYRGLVQEDPNTAISMIEEMPTGPQRDQLLSITLSEWSKIDVDSVFDWIETQETSPLLSRIYGQAMGDYIEQVPQDAVGLISLMDDDINKSNFANRAAFHLAQKSPQEALSWAETLTGEAKHFALMGLMEHWAAGSDGAKALAYAKNNSDNENDEELFAMVAMKFAQGNPELLAEELATLKEGQQRIAATQLAQSYSSHNPEKAVTWLDSLEDGVVRDVALRASLNSFRHSNISQAFELSETFDSESLRHSEMEKILLEWISVDPQAAVAALENTDTLSEERKRKMQNYLVREAPNSSDYLLPEKSSMN